MAAILISACDTSVQSTVPSDEYHYSIFGVLNPAQDTQWVRVESLGAPTSGGASSSLNVTVTLHNVETGETWALQDSLMEVFRDEFQHNFWTQAPITPSTTYEVTVQNADGDTTRATTTTPARAPDIRIENPIRLPCTPPVEANRFEVKVREIEELAGLEVLYFQSVYGPTVIQDYDHYGSASKTNEGFSAYINYYNDLQSAQRTRSRPCLVDSAKVIAAAGGPDWPEWARYHDATIGQLARPDSFSNVEGGHGTLAGVYLDTVDVPIDREN